MPLAICNNIQNTAITVAVRQQMDVLKKPVVQFLEIVEQKFINIMQPRCSSLREAIEHIITCIRERKQLRKEQLILLGWELDNAFIRHGPVFYRYTTVEKGETSLHHAVRYGNADITMMLLDAGADANVLDSIGRTPLHLAVAAEAVDVFEVLLHHRATKLNARMCDGRTPLMLAMRLSIDGMVKDLIDAGANVNVEDNSGTTALHLAAKYRRTGAARMLLDAGADPNLQDNYSRTPLHVAVGKRAVGVFKVLLRQRTTDLNAEMRDGTTPLILASRYGIDVMVKELINAGANLNEADNSGMTPLHSAVGAKALEVFKLLLRYRAVDLNARMKNGSTPLILASRLALVGMLEDLIAADVEVGAADNSGRTALHWAAAANCVRAIDILLAHGAIQIARDEKGETPLHVAARYGRPDATRRLLDIGADANLQSNDGSTPLHLAVAADGVGACEVLLRHPYTDLNARKRDGSTPLTVASQFAMKGVVEDLIGAGASVDEADQSGKTSLHWAAAVDNVDAINALLIHGANRDARNGKCETPLFIAAREGSVEACKLLLDHCADRKIEDHAGRVPRDVAMGKLMSSKSIRRVLNYNAVVRILDRYVPNSP